MDLYNFQSVASETNAEHSVIEVQLSMRQIPAAIPPVVEQLMLVIRACQCIHREDRTLEAALQAALMIAVVASDFNTPGAAEDIRVKCRCESEKEVLVMISLARAMTLQSREWAAERTVHLIKRCVDEVRFAQDGTSLHLRKRRDSEWSLAAER